MFTTLFLKKVGFEFARTFVVVLILGILPVWDAIASGDMDGGKAAIIALIAAAGNAALRAVQALVTQAETPPELKQ